MHKRWLMGTACVVFVFITVGFYWFSRNSHSTGVKKSIYPFDSRIVAKDNRFSFKLFKEVAKNAGDENVFISPLSVATALALAYNGSAGETKSAMEGTLELQGMSLAEVNKANSALIASLEEDFDDPGFRVSIANSVWISDRIPIRQDFARNLQDFYWAKISELDFTDPGAEKVINAWVKCETQGRIDSAIEEINPDDVAIVVNATYFNANWLSEFPESMTRDREFFLAGGGKKMHPMMHQSDEFMYYKGDGFQAVCLPYRRHFSMYVLLPDRASNLGQFFILLNSDNWNNWMSGFEMREGEIALPRFKFGCNFQMRDALSAVGMEIAFDVAKADFSNLTSNTQSNLGEVIHKTFVT